jgi:hypothetical protein
MKKIMEELEIRKQKKKEERKEEERGEGINEEDSIINNDIKINIQTSPNYHPIQKFPNNFNPLNKSIDSVQRIDDIIKVIIKNNIGEEEKDILSSPSSSCLPSPSSFLSPLCSPSSPSCSPLSSVGEKEKEGFGLLEKFRKKMEEMEKKKQMELIKEENDNDNNENNSNDNDHSKSNDKQQPLLPLKQHGRRSR